jgi:hypothetical protein
MLNYAGKTAPQKGRSRSVLAGDIRFRGGSPSEEKVPKLLFAQHPPHFPECKQRNESAKYDDAAAQEIIDAYLARRRCHIVAVDKPLDQFFDNMKGEDQQAKQKCLVNGRFKQWLGFLLPAQMRIFSYQNNFGDYQSVEQRKAVG